MIEAIVEDLGAKRELFARSTRLRARCDRRDEHERDLGDVDRGRDARPERVVGLHFFNPAPLMKLVEVVRTARLDEECFADALGRTGARQGAVACPDTPGFVVNRLLIPLLNDAVRMHEEAGVPPEDIDRALKFGAGWPMGPFALADMIGLDVHVHAAEALWEEPRAADGAAGAAGANGARGPLRAQERPRLLIRYG